MDKNYPTAIHVQEQHPVDDALGCMVPFALGFAIGSAAFVWIAFRFFGY